MIDISKLKDLTNSSRFGSCTSCGKTPKEDKEIVRIRLGDRQGISVCLCSECLKVLQKKITEERP